MMLPVGQNDVFTQFEKYTRFQRFIGMSTLIYSRGKIRASRKWFMINLVSTSSFLLANFFTLNSVRKSALYLSKWYYYMSTGNYMFVTWAIVASWIQCNRNVDLLNRVLFRIRAVDLQIISLGEKLEPIKTNWTQILIYVLVSSAFLLRIILVRTFIGSIFLFIVYVPFILVVSIQDNIVRIGSLLRLRASAINQQIIRCFELEAKNAVTVLKKLVLCHHHLSVSSADLDKYHSLQVVSILASTFVSSFSEVFAIISIFQKNDSVANKNMTLIIKTFWIIVIINLFSGICHMFQAITTKAKEFNTLLYQIMIEDKTNEILNNPKLKLHIAMNREVVFTAYGFFNLDYSLVHSIIASSTTYLVILLQFSEEPASDPGGVTSGNIGNATTTPLPFFLTTV
ncbi:Gustatory receptor 139c [Halyomorpha halys]|nr:Gustatory receptor 139c [Halyomorpha halys]